MLTKAAVIWSQIIKYDNLTFYILKCNLLLWYRSWNSVAITPVFSVKKLFFVNVENRWAAQYFVETDAFFRIHQEIESPSQKCMCDTCRKSLL